MNFTVEKPPSEGDLSLWLSRLRENLTLVLSNIGEENLSPELLQRIGENNSGKEKRRDH